MRTPTIAPAAAALAALVGLVGCASPSGPPPPITDEEITAILHEQDLRWWDSMFPGEDPPQVEVIGAPTWEDQSQLVSACVAKEHLPGFETTGFAWDFTTDDPEVQDRFSRAMWACTVAYPVDESVVGMLSRDQLDWFYDFIVTRYAPCMAGLGYEVRGLPDKETFLQESTGYPAWFPYPETIRPVVQPEDQPRVRYLCPLPEMVEHLWP